MFGEEIDLMTSFYLDCVIVYSVVWLVYDETIYYVISCAQYRSKLPSARNVVNVIISIFIILCENKMFSLNPFSLYNMEKYTY